MTALFTCTVLTFCLWFIPVYAANCRMPRIRKFELYFSFGGQLLAASGSCYWCSVAGITLVTWSLFVMYFHLKVIKMMRVILETFILLPVLQEITNHQLEFSKESGFFFFFTFKQLWITMTNRKKKKHLKWDLIIFLQLLILAVLQYRWISNL